MSELHVRQIETYLRDAYPADWNAALDDANNLSRLLARFAVDLSLGEASKDGSSLVEITDGNKDKGIDAIAVDPVSSLVVVVQSKWRQDGTGSVDLGSALKFVDGIRSLLDIDASMPAACSEGTKNAVRAAMQTPGGRLRILVATTASNQLADEVRAPIEKLLGVLNDMGDAVEESAIAEFQCLTQSSFFEALAKPPRTAIDLDIQLMDWGRTTDPVPAFYGRASALAVAEWFAAHGSALYAENIRVVLPKSEINEGILRTLRDDPERFWYYNNGITVLAQKIDRSLAGAANREAGYFKAKGASIVNGAQTVSTLGRGFAQGDADQLGRAFVSVRVIEVSAEADELARRITRFANTQNVVSSQDFVFLDDDQHRLAKELRLEGYEFLLRSGESPTLRDRERVIDVRQAAVALACASTSLAHAVLAKREVSRLFDRETGPYKALFNPTVNGVLVHRAVDLVKAVERALEPAVRANDGIRTGVAVHGNRVIAHLLLNRIGRESLLDSDYDYEAAIKDLDADVQRMLDAMTAIFPANAYPGNVFKNQARCQSLITQAGV